MAKNIMRGAICRYFGRRHLVAFLTFLGMSISYAMRFCLSIAITEMAKLPVLKVDENSCPLPENYDDGTNSTAKETRFDWSGHQQGIINSAFFWGYSGFQIPGGIAADRFGGRKVITVGVFSTGVFSIITPFAAIYLDWIGLTVARICVGLSQAFFFAATHQVVAQWIPLQERGTWGTFVFSGINIGSALNYGFSGLFLYYVKGRWDLLFIMYGSIGILWSIIFFFLTYDSPKDHPYMSESEKEILGVNKEKTKKERKKTPWKAIVTSLPVLAAAVANIGHDFGYFALLTDLPKFMKTVLHFDVKKNGMLNMATYFSIWLVGILSGILVDFVNNRGYITVTTNRKIGTTIASFFPSLGFITSVYVGCDTTVVTVCLLLGQAFLGVYYPSLKVNSIDLTKNFAGTVSAFIVAIGTTSGIVVSYLIGALTPNNAQSEWRLVMWIIFGVMTLTNIFYLIFASGERQPWDADEEKKVTPETKSTESESADVESRKSV